MEFTLETAIPVLKRTPGVLTIMLQELPSVWITTNEGENTWSVYDTVGHLLHGEKADWLVRAEIILSANEDKRFKVFDRFAHFETSRGKSLSQLLDEFKVARQENIERLLSMSIDQNDVAKSGIHPEFGPVSLGQLLATWVVHDLNHISQISRVMAKQYKDAVGPWINYLRILKD